jgi:hypothetical protein
MVFKCCDNTDAILRQMNKYSIKLVIILIYKNYESCKELVNSYNKGP